MVRAVNIDNSKRKPWLLEVRAGNGSGGGDVESLFSFHFGFRAKCWECGLCFCAPCGDLLDDLIANGQAGAKAG